MTVAFVLGNGRSRLNITPEKLKSYGTIYGCNALYREFAPDFLIAVDTKMIIEICESRYQITNQVWTNRNKQFEKYSNLNFFERSRGWSSGPTALLKSCMDGNRNVFILGFDYYGLNNKVNNVYSDTRNYKKSFENATYYGNWLKQTIAVTNEFPHINFYRVIDENTKKIKEFESINNLKEISYPIMYSYLESMI